MKFIEKKFKKEVKKEIIKCRPGDWNHALRVVKLVKKLGIGRKDINLLIISAYLHDIGWRNILPKKKNPSTHILKMKFIEKKFKKEVKKEIIKCRPGDWNHALRVVKLVKKLGIGRKDINLLIISAYLHDIGWRNILPKKKITFNDLLKFEKKANGNSTNFVKEFLLKKGFSDEEIKKVNRLVFAVDKHRSELEDEKIIVDADNISKLSIQHLREKYTKKDWKKMIELWKQDFSKRIKTKKGKSLYPILIRKLEKISPG